MVLQCIHLSTLLGNNLLPMVITNLTTLLPIITKVIMIKEVKICINKIVTYHLIGTITINKTTKKAIRTRTTIMIKKIGNKIEISNTKDILMITSINNNNKRHLFTILMLEAALSIMMQILGREVKIPITQ